MGARLVLIMLISFRNTACFIVMPRPFSAGSTRQLRHLPLRHLPPRLLGDDKGKLVELVDESSGKSLSCFVAGSVNVEGILYAALYPANAPATLATMEQGRLTPLDTETETAVMVAAQAACLKVGAELLDSPVVLTLTGEAIDKDLDLDAERGSGSWDGDSDDEDMVVVADFEFENKQIFVLRMLDPIYVAGREGPTEQVYVVPTDEEMDTVGVAIEELVEEIEESLNAQFDEDELAP